MTIDVRDHPAALQYEASVDGEPVGSIRYTKGLHVRPLCPFLAGYIDRHPEYEDLVAAKYRDRSADPVGR